MSFKRIPVKWIRDKAKAAYEKDSCCYICDVEENLELHHIHGITELFEAWVTKHGYIVESDEDILSLRDDFIAEHTTELYEDVYTLCSMHHKLLHSIFGQSPELETAPKQRKWVESKKAKPSTKRFGKHYGSN